MTCVLGHYHAVQSPIIIWGPFLESDQPKSGRILLTLHPDTFIWPFIPTTTSTNMLTNYSLEAMKYHTVFRISFLEASPRTYLLYFLLQNLAKTLH